MDSITHALTGYAISCVLYNRNKIEDKKEMRALRTSVVLGAVCPDIDFVAEFFGGNTMYFMSHRTVTHSPIGLIIISILCAAGIKMARRELKFSLLFIGAFLGAISHVLFDITNIYSTLALWPLTDKMYSLGFLAIIDAFILGVLIISIVMSFIKPLKLYEKKIFEAALIVIVCYIGLKAYMQYDLKGFIISEYRRGSFTSEIKPEKETNAAVLTDYIGINSWNFIIENSNEFIKGNVRYYDHKVSGTAIIKKRTPDKAYESAYKTPLGKFLLKFTPFVDYSVTNYDKGYVVHMVDLRYTFPLRLTGRDKGYSHILGAYIVLDKNYNPVSWSTRNPLDVHLDF